MAYDVTKEISTKLLSCVRSGLDITCLSNCIPGVLRHTRYLDELEEQECIMDTEGIPQSFFPILIRLSIPKCCAFIVIQYFYPYAHSFALSNVCSF